MMKRAHKLFIDTRALLLIFVVLATVAWGAIYIDETYLHLRKPQGYAFV